MKKKQCYLILGQKNRRVYGAFDRTPEGRKAAKIYRDQLIKKNKIKLVIK